MAEPLARAMGWAVAAVLLAVGFPAMARQAAPAPALRSATPPPPLPYRVPPGTPPGVPGPMASLIRAQGTIPDVHPGKTFYLVADEKFAAVIVIENGRLLGGRSLLSPEAVLRVLADRRLDFMWPALEAWAGPGLAPMRARALADALERYRTGTPRAARGTAESSARPATRALLQLATEFDRAGITEEAVALLREPLAKPPGKSDAEMADYAMTAQRLATIRYGRGDMKEAAEVLLAAGAALSDSHYALNFDINRASYLVLGGQFAEGLELADRTLVRYGGETDEKYRVPGSMRQFALIRACALNGLGRKDEAAVEMRALLNAPEPSDPVFVLTNNTTLYFRALLCQRDVEALADFIVKALNGPSIADGLMLWLQRDFEPYIVDPALVQAVRAHPKVKAAMAARIRVLGPELKAVLNRTPAAP